VNQNRPNWDSALQDFYWPATAEYGQLMIFVSSVGEDELQLFEGQLSPNSGRSELEKFASTIGRNRPGAVSDRTEMPYF